MNRTGKTVTALLLVAVLVAVLFMGCGGKKEGKGVTITVG